MCRSPLESRGSQTRGHLGNAEGGDWTDEGKQRTKCRRGNRRKKGLDEVLRGKGG